VKLFDALTPFFTQIPTVIRVLFVVRARKEIKGVLDYLENNFKSGILRLKNLSKFCCALKLRIFISLLN
jgi:hypothetical protein